MPQMMSLMQNYTLENARAVARKLTSQFRGQSLDTAIFEASDALAMTGNPGRVQVYFAANFERCSPLQFDEMLMSPNTDLGFFQGPPNQGKPIYPTWEEALEGTIAGDNPRQHAAFFIYDSNAVVIVDYVNRHGQTLMNRARREQYLASLERWFGESLEWRAPEQKPIIADEFQ
ncbi:MAG: hypothetical protein Q8Q31_05215 [Nanoarchaeota archaeon]|nr:hypothetical protein [Nanoarchaeota archaeon]